MRTAFLMTALTVLLVLVGDYFGGARGMMMMLIISLAMNLFSYWNSDKLVLAQYNAKQVDEKSAPALYKMVQRLAERGNLPMPKVYIIDSPVPNAFATGRNPEHAAVAVTTALANALDKDEIEGVLAHELSHVKHGDILIGTIAASMAGIITTLSHWGMFFGGGDRDRNSSSSAIVGLAMMILAPLAAGIIQMAVSRSREYMADKSGGELSGNPDALADALLKIESYAKNRTMPGATENTAHMFIICPFSAKDMQQLFSTHPRTADRVARLRAQAKAMRSSGGAK
jgi:heat shock protein HtpX